MSVLSNLTSSNSIHLFSNIPPISVAACKNGGRSEPLDIFARTPDTPSTDVSASSTVCTVIPTPPSPNSEESTPVADPVLGMPLSMLSQLYGLQPISTQGQQVATTALTTALTMSASTAVSTSCQSTSYQSTSCQSATNTVADAICNPTVLIAPQAINTRSSNYFVASSSPASDLESDELEFSIVHGRFVTRQGPVSRTAQKSFHVISRSPTPSQSPYYLPAIPPADPVCPSSTRSPRLLERYGSNGTPGFNGNDEVVTFEMKGVRDIYIPSSSNLGNRKRGSSLGSGHSPPKRSKGPR